MSDSGAEGTLQVAVEVRYPNGAPSEVRETLHQAGDLIGTAIGTESLGSSVDAILAPLAEDVTTAFDAAQAELTPNARDFTWSVQDIAQADVAAHQVD